MTSDCHGHDEFTWPMRTLLNVIWLVLCGFWMAVGYVIAGVICCVLIVTVPFGLASFRIAGYALWVIRADNDRSARCRHAVGGRQRHLDCGHGWWLAIGHIAGIGLCLTVIGIPLGIANFKLIPVSLVPLGKQIVPVEQPYGVE